MNEAQELLMRVQLYDANIENMVEELQQLNDIALKITSTMGGEVVSGTRAQDKLGIAVSKLVDYADEINRTISEYKEKKQAISAKIRKIENADQIKVLHKLYFEYKPWKVIAQEMHMTERNAQYIHNDALLSFERVLRGEGMRNEA